MIARDIAEWREGEHETGVFSQDNEHYHASDGVSKSGLWTLYSECPAKFRFGERVAKNHFTFGQAAHDAVLQPEVFETGYLRGPETRRGKAWDGATMEAHAMQRQLLTAGDYDNALRVRDSAGRNARLQLLLRDAVFEQSAYARDPKTGVIVRAKPDAYSPSNKIIIDLKTSRSVKPRHVQRAIDEYGYHVQEPMYSEVWQRAGGGDVEGFVFFFIESAAPFIVKPYELPPGAHAEGYAIYRMALGIYAECKASDEWPAYGDEVEEIDIPTYAYRLTKQPDPEPADLAGLDPLPDDE